MNNTREKLNSLGVEIPSILLPKTECSERDTDLQKWAVIACDQFTQDRDYWAKVKAAAEGAPSTLNMIFPEVFLPDGNAEQRISDIHSTMKQYMQEGVFAEPKQGFIYIERDTPYYKKRRGLVVAIDLEQYDWKPVARPLIRSTEGTVEDRLPPRMDIRRGAPLELPHVLLLIDDDDADSLLSVLGERVKNNNPVYNTQLMMDNGSVSGWFVDSETDMSFIADKLEGLCRRSSTRYAKPSAPFLFAVGDGNHSLATAKGIWEEYKAAHYKKTVNTDSKLPVHPCRYALVEIENIYDPAIQFEPIHRLVLDMGFDKTMSLLSRLPDFSSRTVNSAEEISALVGSFNETRRIANCFGVISEGRYALVETSASGIATACLQPLLDDVRPALEIDYIHDDAELLRLAAPDSLGRKTAGILLPPVSKAGLFQTVARLGPLPRKSFSMGHSCEKRFYLECRSLELF